MAEQVVGQMLRTCFFKFVDPTLHYYVRDVKGSEAEVLLQQRKILGAVKLFYHIDKTLVSRPDK